MSNFILENFLSLEQENAVYDLATDHRFPWFFQNGTILKQDADQENKYIHIAGSNPPQFSHPIDVQNCPYIETVSPVLNTFATEFQSNIQIIKMKFNLLYKSSDGSFHYPHTDVDELNSNIKTSIYYVNDSDGDTYLFDQFGPRTSEELTIQKQISPARGRLVVFDAVQFHASSSPTQSDYRIILNTVFKVTS